MNISIDDVKEFMVNNPLEEQIKDQENEFDEIHIKQPDFEVLEYFKVLLI